MYKVLPEPPLGKRDEVSISKCERCGGVNYLLLVPAVKSSLSPKQRKAICVHCGPQIPEENLSPPVQLPTSTFSLF